MINKLINLEQIQIRPSLKTKLISKWIYNYLAKRSPSRKNLLFMNYGYAPLDTVKSVQLENEDEVYRYPIQLYHHVVSAISIKNLDVLEVGCGRGGGASYIKRYFQPRTMIAIDLSKKNIELCNQYHLIEGLSFLRGDAENFEFSNACFDVVINIESSHCYNSIDKFFMEVKRVLRNKGYFLYADLRWSKDIYFLDKQVSNSGMSIIKKNDITPNVFKSLNMDNERKTATLREESKNEREFKKWSNWAALKGSNVYEAFKSGKLIYQSFVLQKNDGSSF